jgi:4-hydroxysphinganine ceramide fatty acyl 2-hydroxylase
MFAMFSKIVAESVHARTLFLIGVCASALLLASWMESVFSLGLLLLGFFAWTLAEYFLHRVVFHLPLTHPLRFLGATMHAAHHEAPNKPPITKPPALTLSAFAVACLSSYLMLGGVVLSFFSGMLFGYLWYETSHVAAHVLTPSEHPFPSFQENHLMHHQTPSSRFGITSPLWDYVFKSRE